MYLKFSLPLVSFFPFEGKIRVEKKFLNGNSAKAPAGIFYARGWPVHKHR